MILFLPPFLLLHFFILFFFVSLFFLFLFSFYLFFSVSLFVTNGLTTYRREEPPSAAVATARPRGTTDGTEMLIDPPLLLRPNVYLNLTVSDFPVCSCSFESVFLHDISSHRRVATFIRVKERNRILGYG